MMEGNHPSTDIRTFVSQTENVNLCRALLEDRSKCAHLTMNNMCVLVLVYLVLSSEACALYCPTRQL